MILYRIRRKDNGKFFGGLAYPWHHSGKEKWNDKGAFYRDIDTITMWLKILCYDWKNNIEVIRTTSHWSARKMAAKIDEYDKNKLKNYEIVVNNVTVKGTKIIQAKDLMA